MTNDNSPPATSPPKTVSPDALMSDFRGRPILTIVVFTILIHAVVIGGFSFAYLKDTVFGKDTSGLSEQERLNQAYKEATQELPKIAEKYNVSAQALTDRLSNGDGVVEVDASGVESKSSSPKNATQPTEDQSLPSTDSSNPKSAIEAELEKQESGPAIPDLPDGLPLEDDLFGE